MEAKSLAKKTDWGRGAFRSLGRFLFLVLVFAVSLTVSYTAASIIVGRGILTVNVTEPSSPEEFVIYSDAGFAGWGPNSHIYTWGEGYFNSQCGEIGVPEGQICFKTITSDSAGWGYFWDGRDMSPYAGGHLKFWVLTRKDLRIEITASDMKCSKWISAYGWNGDFEWQEISIPVSDFTSNLSNVTSPFMCTIYGGTPVFPVTFYIDYIRWTRY
ncbi:MAG: hypothetical protein QXG10_01640 [Candidatus Hadarchaeales archaeon]